MLDDFAEFESQMETYTTDILKFYAKNDGFTNIDSIKDNLNTITSRRTFNPINITYKEMVSTGNIGLVLNRDLKNKIVRYYNSLERLTLIIQNNNTFLVDQIFNPVVLKYTLFTIDLSDERFSKTTDSIIQENKLLTLKHTSNHLL